jgi:alkanesulfonate monooxygenase SsuD/methylene tetrahydromethanopterin reductase-like flavin-dependent oxidoreductase (luciferase family)
MGVKSNNYRHALRFGLALNSITAETLIEQATLAESLGYDLVSTGDSAGFDAWSALSWIAGRTEHIRLLPILTLTQQSPAVIGRAAASLDLLSGGRLQLGLTAADRRIDDPRTGETRIGKPSTDDTSTGADDLAEAIEIIRAVWAVGETAPLRHVGARYRLDGAARGPMPAHSVPILVQGTGERMLRLIGAAADGWLVRYPAALESGNIVVDGAARESRRDVREIRRTLEIDPIDGPVPDWVAQLLPLVTRQGVGGFLLKSDDPETTRRFITEVAPALREAADRELPGLSAAGSIRPTAVIAKRTPGIDYESVPRGVAVIEPGDLRYPEVRSTYLRGGAPGIVLLPETTEQVADAVGYARNHPALPLGIRSRGHGISGRSTNRGGLVIDVSALNSITVLDASTRRVRVGPGATWSEVAAALEPFGWAISSGDYGGVGVGGLATAGGIGFLGRAHGLTIDHLRAVEVVLADGRLLRASDAENRELFWAMRGAGANFGIATSFEFEAKVVPGVGWAQFVFDASDTAGFLVKWGATLEASPRDSTSFLVLGAPRHGEPTTARFSGMVNSTDPDTIIARLQPFAEIAPLYQQSVQLLSYSEALMPAQGDANGGGGEPVSRSGLLTHVTPEFAEAAARLLQSRAAYFFQLRATGGAASDIAPDATAYAHRSANFSVVAFGSNRERLNREWERLEPLFDGLYLSFETDTSEQRIHDAFPPRTLSRLRALKARYDPHDLFHDNFAIGVATDAGPRTDAEPSDAETRTDTEPETVQSPAC